MTSTKNKDKGAVKFFHGDACNWNCAQAIIKSRQTQLGISDQNIELQYRSKGGGRAENGLCGAIYAAQHLLDSTAGKLLTNKIHNQLGAITCKGLKGERRIPCPAIVQLVDELLTEQEEQGDHLHIRE